MSMLIEGVASSAILVKVVTVVGTYDGGVALPYVQWQQRGSEHNGRADDFEAEGTYMMGFTSAIPVVGRIEWTILDFCPQHGWSSLRQAAKHH